MAPMVMQTMSARCRCAPLVGEADHGEDRGQQHRALAPQRLAAHLLEYDEADDPDDGQDLDRGHGSLPST
jgi:hypothetical protein